MLQNLCSVGATSETQRDMIMRRYHEKDPLLLAALDVRRTPCSRTVESTALVTRFGLGLELGLDVNALLK